MPGARFKKLPFPVAKPSPDETDMLAPVPARTIETRKSRGATVPSTRTGAVGTMAAVVGAPGELRAPSVAKPGLNE